MTKFNFTEEQIRQAQKVADLMVTLNRVGDGSYGKSTEDVEKFIKIVNGISANKENKGVTIKVNTGENISNKNWSEDKGRILKDWNNNTASISKSLMEYIEEIQKIAKKY